LKELKQRKMKAQKVRIKDLKNSDLLQLELSLLVDENVYTTEVYYELKHIEHIVSVEMESL
jgi:putative Mg2+ transporter-C (MgtC) family protein